MKIKEIETNKTTTYEIKGKNYSMLIECEYAKTRNGFKHECYLTIWSDTLAGGGGTTAFNKCCYLNRTWERFTFESCINGAFYKLNNCLRKSEKTRVKRIKTALYKRINNHKNIEYQWIGG